MRLTNREKILIIITLILLIIYIYFAFYLKPIMDKISEANIYIKQNSQLIEKYDKIRQDIDNQYIKIKRYDHEINQIIQSFFNPLDISAILIMLEKLEIRYDIIIESINVNDYIERQGYRILPVDIKFKADQEKSYKVIKDIENYNKRISLLNVNINDQKDDGFLNISLKLAFYEIIITK